MMPSNANAETPELVEYPHKRAIRLRNRYCAYCNSELTKAGTTKEHVIGRRFVPKGKFNAQWNLIVNACGSCNNRKSDLEDDIAAVTLQASVLGLTKHDDPVLEKEAQNRAKKAISRRSKKAVGQSHEHIDVKFPFGSVATFAFNLTSPPQIDEKRIFELARLQLCGFFYWLTYMHNGERGGFWTGEFCPMSYAYAPDWGNSLLAGFAGRVLDWEPRILASTADGFYKVVVRRAPDAECWSWALEWNCSLRVIGFFGDREYAQGVCNRIAPPAMMTLRESPDRYIRYRTEVPLDPEKDQLFAINDE